MSQLRHDEPFKLNLLSLNCHIPISGKEVDHVFLKHNEKRLYPTSGSKFLELKKNEGHKFENLSLTFQGRVDVDTIVIELWYRKNLFQNVLGGRFFFMLNISEIGFSATQLIRSSVQEQSHYLIHWEMRSLENDKAGAYQNKSFRSANF